MTLEGSVAIVTGSSTGIGRGIALALGRAGVKVAVVARTASKVSDVVDEIGEAGGVARGVVCDVGVRADVFSMVDSAVADLGGVDILVNNAQTFSRPSVAKANDKGQPLETFDEEDWEVVYRTGLLATLWAMKAVFPHMKDTGGKIINMGSSAGQFGLEGFAAYAATKEGIRGLTRVAAREWGKYGINVNVINPGILTEKMRTQFGDQPEIMAQMEQRAVRRTGDPERDAGGLVKFLASHDSDYLTGMTFMLDGGRFMWA